MATSDEGVVCFTLIFSCHTHNEFLMPHLYFCWGRKWKWNTPKQQLFISLLHTIWCISWQCTKQVIQIYSFQYFICIGTCWTVYNYAVHLLKQLQSRTLRSTDMYFNGISNECSQLQPAYGVYVHKLKSGQGLLLVAGLVRGLSWLMPLPASHWTLIPNDRKIQQEHFWGFCAMQPCTSTMCASDRMLSY